MKIGWYTDAVLNPPSDLFVIEPIRLSEQEKNLGNYKHCPAFSQYVNQTFVINSPFDLELSFSENKVRIVKSSLDKSEYEKNITVDIGQYPIIQMELHIGVVADAPCSIEVFGPFFSPSQKDSTYRVIPGSYDIFSWQRFLNFAFEWTDLEKNITIKRGQPLLYMRFRSKNINEKFQMLRIEMTDELLAAVKRCQSSKLFMKGKSWNLMPINKILRFNKKFIP